jgi:hypothetical protein
MACIALTTWVLASWEVSSFDKRETMDAVCANHVQCNIDDRRDEARGEAWTMHVRPK